MKTRILISLFMILTIGGSVFSEGFIKVDSLDVGFANLFPIGEMKKISDANFGLRSQLNLTLGKLDFLRVFAGVGANYSLPKGDVALLSDLYLGAGGGVNFKVASFAETGGLYLGGQFTYGPMLHIVNGTWSGSEETKLFVDQSMLIDGEVSYLLPSEKLALFLQATLLLFPEDGSFGIEIGYTLGSRFKL